MRTAFVFVLFVLLTMLIGPVAFAQNTLTFSAETTTGDGTVTPVLTWSTSPLAESCTASGDWSGQKGGEGMETLPATNESRTYNLACTWPGDSIATFSWTNPTLNENGTPYTDPKEVVIKYRIGQTAPTASSTCGAQGVVCVTVPHPQTMRTVTGITQTGTLRAIAQACNQRDVCSVASNTATKVFTGMVTVDRSVGITVNPVPGPIADFAVE